ncbi:MAG: DMT family transporter [Methylophilaceae bacterium]
MSIGKNKNFFAIFGLLFGASVWGIIWYPYRLLELAGVSGVVASFYTYLIAMVIGCLIFCRHWRGLFKQPKSMIWLMLAAGWTNLSYVLAVIDGEVMRVILLFYLSPVWALILAHFWLKEQIGIKEVGVIVVSLLGAIIMMYDMTLLNSMPLPRSHSDWLALSAGIGFALTNVITRKSVHLTIVAKSFAVWVGVVIVSLAGMFILTENATSPLYFNLYTILLAMIVALLLFLSALTVQYGVTHVPAARAAVIFLFELVVAAIAAYFLADEAMALNEWVGGAMIVVAATYASLGENSH